MANVHETAPTHQHPAPPPPHTAHDKSTDAPPPPPAKVILTKAPDPAVVGKEAADQWAKDQEAVQKQYQESKDKVAKDAEARGEPVLNSAVSDALDNLYAVVNVPDKATVEATLAAAGVTAKAVDKSTEPPSKK